MTESAFKFQKQNNTVYNRHPHIFRSAAEFLGDRKELNILSFGCSRGQEVKTLADRYFISARIVGLDIDSTVLDEARALLDHPEYKGRIELDYSTPDSLGCYGPFDAIFAMSVLCAWPETLNLTDITNVFPFSKFDAAVCALDAAIKPGGLLAIFNSNFRFSDSSIRYRYQPVEIPEVNGSGYVKQFGPDNKALAGHDNEKHVLFVKNRIPL